MTAHGNSTDDIECDIVVVGAGLVGATLACALAVSEYGANYRIVVIDAGSEPKLFHDEVFDPRVVALTRGSQTLFEKLGVWSTIINRRACAYRKMFVWDGEGTGSIEFDCRELHQPDLGHIVENSVVLRSVLDQLETQSSVELKRGVMLEALIPADENVKKARLQLSDGSTITASLVLAADGANSKVRQLLSMRTREWNYGQAAIVTTVRTEWPHQNTAWQRFMSTGPLAFLPLSKSVTNQNDSLGEDGYCSIVWSMKEDCVPDLLAQPDDEFAAALARAFEFKLGNVVEVQPRFSFPLRQRHAVRYIQPGVALLGDAAHTIHPLAGQGVNLGLLDVQAMVAELERATRRQLPLDDFSVLRRYQRARMANNLAMMGAMEGFKRLFGSDNSILHVARNLGMGGLHQLPPLKNAIARHAMGL